MKEIQLTKGKKAIVDEDVFNFLSQFNWYYGKGYAMTMVSQPSGRTYIYMHKMLMFAGPGQIVDHINGDKLDNRRENLRLSSHYQNLANRPAPVNNKTGYKGVSYNKTARKYTAQITVKGEYHYLGLYKTPEEAALAWNDKAYELLGEFAKLNDIRK